MIKFSKGFALSMCALAICIGGVSVMAVAFVPAFYWCEFEKLDIYSEFSGETRASPQEFSRNELHTVTTQLIAYLAGARSTLDHSFFSEREKEHMRDVQRRFIGGLLVWVAALTFLIVYLWRRPKSWRTVLRGGSILNLALLAVLGLCAVSNFEGFFRLFHLLSFSNELWLLDPAQSNLIHLVPEQFFFDATLAICIWSAVLNMILLLVTQVKQISRVKSKTT